VSKLRYILLLGTSNIGFDSRIFEYPVILSVVIEKLFIKALAMHVAVNVTGFVYVCDSIYISN
jgi:hypothetical protein